MSKRWRVAGINFEHFHMGDNLAYAAEVPNVEIVGVCHEDPTVMQPAIRKFALRDHQIFTDYRACIEQSKPDFVIACPAAASHGEWAERLLGLGVHVMMEKPMAASLEEADRMIAAARVSGKQLSIHWPMIAYAPHRTAYRMIREGKIGRVREVHYYDGNRGPLWHTAGKADCTAEEVATEKPKSWFYKRALGGGSLLDYLGYGTTLGTWFNGGRVPLEVTALVDQPAGLEVDEHAIVIARYEEGLSKFETRWGTYTDPWTHQPQPKCGFVLVGSEGTLSCYDGEQTVRWQHAQCPQGEDMKVDTLSFTQKNPVAYLLECLETGQPVEGPMSLATSRIGQQIVDAAVKSIETRQVVRVSAGVQASA